MENNSKLGYDHATTGVEPVCDDPEYLRGYRQGLEKQMIWAGEALMAFDALFADSYILDEEE